MGFLHSKELISSTTIYNEVKTVAYNILYIIYIYRINSNMQVKLDYFFCKFIAHNYMIINQ